MFQNSIFRLGCPIWDREFIFWSKTRRFSRRHARLQPCMRQCLHLHSQTHSHLKHPKHLQESTPVVHRKIRRPYVGCGWTGIFPLNTFSCGVLLSHQKNKQGERITELRKLNKTRLIERKELEQAEGVGWSLPKSLRPFAKSHIHASFLLHVVLTLCQFLRETWLTQRS